MDYKDKKFLITHTIIRNYMGSTIVAIELAEYLLEQGAEVDVYTFAAGNPMLEEFKTRGIQVLAGNESEQIEIESYDFVWVHSQVLPAPVLAQIAANEDAAKLPAFIFHHMSPLEAAADERPYVYGIENALSSLSTFMSENTRTEQLPYFEANANMALFRNPAPYSYCALDPPLKSNLQRVLIVSGHAPAEVKEAARILREEHGLVVDHLGHGGNMQTLVSPELLAQYDCVITIGKTVQYCLVGGIPVFVYDHFGGYGYLNEDIYERAAEYNFAGRNGEKYTAEYIAETLLASYGTALIWQTERRGSFIEEYYIGNVLGPILENAVAHKRQSIVLDERVLLAAQSAEVFSQRHWSLWLWRDNNALKVQEHSKLLRQVADKDLHIKQLGQDKEATLAKVNDLSTHTKELEKELADMQARITSLNAAKKALQQDLAGANNRIAAIKASRSWRLGRAISWPYRKLRKLVTLNK